MPTGPEHYRIAEQQISLAFDAEMGEEEQATHLLSAQVHATLALAAATALRINGEEGMPRNDYVAWTAAAGSDAELKRADADG